MKEQLIFTFRSEDYKFGLVSKAGKVVVSPKFKQVDQEDGCLTIKGSKKDIFYNLCAEEAKAVEVSRDEYFRIAKFFHDGLLRVSKQSKTGYLNYDGELVIPCQYYSENDFSDGRCLVQMEYKGKCGFIDTEGKLVVPFKYDDAKDFHGGFASVCVDGLWGIIDKEGNEVIAPKFKYIDNYLRVYSSSSGGGNTSTGIKIYEGIFFAKNNDKYGIVDAKGNEILPCTYDEFKVYDGASLVIKDKKIGTFGDDGKIVIPCEYDYMDRWGNAQNIYYWKKDGKYGAEIDGQIVVPCQYDKVSYLTENCFACQNGEFWCLVSGGKEMTLAIYDEIDDLYDGLARVKKNGMYTYVTKEGKELSGSFERADFFRDERANVTIDGKDGLIDTEGNMIVPCQYFNLRDIATGIYSCSRTDESGAPQTVIDGNGKVIVPESSSRFSCIDLCSAFVEEADGKQGLRNKDGELIIPCEYDKISNNWGWIELTKGGNKGIANAEGKIILPIEYSEVYLGLSNQSMILAKAKKWQAFGLDGTLIEAPKAKKAKKAKK